MKLPSGLHPSPFRETGPNELLSGGTPQRFRRRLFLSILALSLLTSTLTGAVFYSLQGKFIAADRARRAKTLLTSLATQAELGAYAHDAALLELPVQRTVREEDVVLAGVYDLSGREIHGLQRPSLQSQGTPSLERLAVLLKNPDAEPLRLDGQGYEDLWAPIVTGVRSAAVAASSEPGETRSRREVVGLARVGLSLRPAREQLAEVLGTVLALTLLLSVLGAAAAALIARRLSGPILALARGADEIRTGNLDVRIDVRSDDELGLLADSFNRMAANLGETVEKLAALNRGLEDEVTRRTDDIRRSAEFTEVLNAPISDGPAMAQPGPRHGELKNVLATALETLQGATGASACAVLLDWEEALDFELQVAAMRGAEARSFGAMPTRAQLQKGLPLIEPGRAIVPILFRGDPEGAFVLLGDQMEAAAVDFASRAAGQLAIAIANAKSFQALRHLTQELTTRNQELTTQRDQLSEMNRLKSEFLANVSHELRTPLNAISGYTELIAEEVYGPVSTEQREALAGVDESSKNLLTLINQILDLSKVESGKIEVYVTEVAIHEIAQSVASESHALAKDRPYRVEVECPDRIVIRTDRAKVQQIITNLVTNAVKFTERGKVRVVCRTMPDGGCTIAVSDTGIGIKPEHLEVIFEEFRQVDGSSTRIYQGTGLGLAIARRFARILGGDVTVDSKLTLGSTFTLRLPATAPSEARAAAASPLVHPTGERPRRQTLPPAVPPQARISSPRIPVFPPPAKKP
jgi:signal transduction histidine kinase/HAMP domain-containing protein